MAGSLQGRRIVVTGASSGIGLSTSRLLAREGARLALMARRREGLDTAARAIAADGGSAEVLPVDVTDRPALDAAMTEAVARLGGIDALVSSVAGLAYGAFKDVSHVDFDRSHEVTFRGVVDPVRAALPELERSGGAIVAVVSMASKVPVPLHSSYVAAKHGVRGFLGSLRVELRNQGSPVQVSMVHPAFIGTPFFDHATSAGETAPQPVPPVYRVDEVAEAVLACLRHPRAEYNVGGSAAAFDLLTRFARPLSELVLSTYGVAAQQRTRPAARPGMLWEPSGDGHATGSVRGRRSLWNAARLAAGRPLDVMDGVPALRSVVRLVR